MDKIFNGKNFETCQIKLGTTTYQGLGKFKTIAIGISVYVAGMCMAAIGSMPEIFGSPVNSDGTRPDDYWQNNISAIRGVALRSWFRHH